jgi:hypothetical protein
MLHGINHNMFGKRDPVQYGTANIDPMQNISARAPVPEAASHEARVSREIARPVAAIAWACDCSTGQPAACRSPRRASSSLPRSVRHSRRSARPWRTWTSIASVRPAFSDSTRTELGAHDPGTANLRIPAPLSRHESRTGHGGAALPLVSAPTQRQLPGYQRSSAATRWPVGVRPKRSVAPPSTSGWRSTYLPCIRRRRKSSTVAMTIGGSALAIISLTFGASASDCGSQDRAPVWCS